MSRPLAGLRLRVVGAGVLGLSTAALAARDGAEVEVLDPRPLADNASGVAAGMLAPALEAALDPPEVAAGARLLFDAYAAWPAFAADLDLPAADLWSGALVLGEAADRARLAETLAALGVAAEPLDPVALARRHPGVAADGGALSVGIEGRTDPPATLAALARALGAHGGRITNRAATSADLAGCDAAVLALGFPSEAWVDLAPELGVLTPIKGHILQFPGAGPTAGPTLRSADGYAAPHAHGVVFGASMQPGVADLTVEPEVVQALRAAAVRLLPGLREIDPVVRTGVRAATPDGLPLVGRSCSGVWLAAGARRNGWLLAPLVARALVAMLAGAPGEPAFDPARFTGGKRP